MKYFFIFLFLINTELFTYSGYVITNKNKDFLPNVFVDKIENLSSNKEKTDDFGIIFFNSLKVRLKSVNVNFVYRNGIDFDIIIKIKYNYEKENLVHLNIDFLDKFNNVIKKEEIYSHTDRRIFDSVDKTYNLILEFVNKIEIISPKIEEKNYGSIYFKDFKVGKENYILYIDDNLISKYVNKNFKKKIELEANKKYSIKLLRDSDEKLIFEKDIFIEKGKTEEIEYVGKGSIFVERIKNPELWRNYKYYFDNKEIEIEKKIEGFEVGRHYNFMVKDNFDRVVYEDLIYLEDGELTVIKPKLLWNDTIKVKFFSVINEYWATGIDYSFLRYYWCGANFGFNTFYYNEKTINISFFTVETGYYFFTDKIFNFKTGIGLSGQYYFINDDTSSIKNIAKNGFSVMLNFELFNFFIKPAIFYDFSNFYFQTCAGLYIKFDLGE